MSFPARIFEHFTDQIPESSLIPEIFQVQMNAVAPVVIGDARNIDPFTHRIGMFELITHGQ